MRTGKGDGIWGGWDSSGFDWLSGVVELVIGWDGWVEGWVGGAVEVDIYIILLLEFSLIYNLSNILLFIIYYGKR